MNLYNHTNILRTNIDFALKKKYSIKIYYSNEIDYKKNNIIWKYPPYLIKNCNTNKIIDELLNYFKNFEDFVLVMQLNGDNIVHKIPIHLPYKN